MPRTVSARRLERRTAEAARHVHDRGHLEHGGLPRCGCPSDVLAPVDHAGDDVVAARAVIRPRRAHIGFIRAHFIYSDRMLGPLR